MADDKIGFGDFLDFSDETPLHKAQQGIARLEKAYEAFVKQSQQQNEALKAALKGVVAAMDTTARALDTVSTSTRKGREEAARLSAQVTKQTQQYTDLRAKMAEQIAQTRALSKEHRDLQKSYALLSKAQIKGQADANKTAEAQMRSQVKLQEMAEQSRIRLAEHRAKIQLSLEADQTKAHRRESERRIKQAEREEAARLKAAQQVAQNAAMRGGDGSINDLKSRRAAATDVYNRMGAGTPELVKEAQLRKVRELSKALNESQAALVLARKGAVAASGSYNALVQQNARLAAQLRSMPNAFDKVTGAINKNNKEAVKLAAQYRQGTEALKQFDARMGMNYRNVGNYRSMMDGAANSLRQFGLGLVGEFASMYALAAATREVFTATLDLSDSQASVMKTVGMTREQVDGLAESFKNIDTRTSLKDLFEIARVGGQFGVASDEIDSFTQAANMAAVALSDEFKGGAEEVATELYILRGLFKETRELDPGEALERIGSAINDLGASGAATGPIVAEFAKRLGQLGEMGPSIQEALGLGAALQEMGLSAEIAAGGVTNLIIQLNKNADKVAHSFGITTAEMQKMLKTDVVGTILNISKALEGLDDSVSIMYDWGVQSQESIKVMNTLSSNMGRVREQLDRSSASFETNTSIMKEYGVVNENAAASWEKLKRALLEPFVSGAGATWLKGVIDDVRTFIRFFSGVENSIASSTARMSRHARVLGEQGRELDALMAAYERLDSVSLAELSPDEMVELQDVMVKIKGIVGESALLLDKETGAYELNTKAVAAKQKALKALETQEKARVEEKLPSLEEEEARLRGEISLLQTELRILDRDTKERPSPTGHAAADAILMYTGINKEMVAWKAQLDKVADKNTEIYEKNEELNDLLLKRKAILEDLSTLIDWGSFFGAGEEEEAPAWTGMFSQEQWDASNKLTIKNKGKKKGGAGTIRDEAAEARHQLELLRAQIAVTRAEWLKQDFDKSLDWEMPENFVKGMEQQVDFLQNELKKLDRNFQAQGANIDFLADERIAQARKEAEEKLRHNKAGKDGVILINAELNERIADINREREADHRKMLERQTKAEQKAADTVTKIQQEAAKMRTKVAEDYLKKAEDKWKGNKQYESDVKEAEQWFEDIKTIQEGLYQLGEELGNAYFDIRRQRLDEEMAYLQNSYQKQIEAAGDNEQLRYELQEEYRQKELALRREQAKAQKQQAIFNIVVSTAMAIANALGQMGPILGPVMAGIIGGMGLAQLAVVMAQPLPQFYRGVERAPEGPAKVAESGPELAISPEGHIVYYDKPQVAYLEQGTEVKTAGETGAILRRLQRTQGEHATKEMVSSLKASERAINVPAPDAPDYDDLKHAINAGNRRVVDAIKGRRETIHHADGTRTERNEARWTTYVNDKYRR